MKKTIYFLFIPLVLLYSGCCDDETVLPDLASALVQESVANVIEGNPFDLEYNINYLESNAKECEYIAAGASVARLLLDFFEDESDTDPTTVVDKATDTQTLNVGGSDNTIERITVPSAGIYMIAVNADDTEIIDETNEDNNYDNETVDTRMAESELFRNPSEAFLNRLKITAAILVNDPEIKNREKTTYRGVPVYFVRH